MVTVKLDKHLQEQQQMSTCCSSEEIFHPYDYFCIKTKVSSKEKLTQRNVPPGTFANIYRRLCLLVTVCYSQYLQMLCTFKAF